jgi:hypothetical protein
MGAGKVWGAVMTMCALALALAAPASATTFCLPSASFAACPSGATVPASLEAALTTSSNDGIPDLVVIDSGLTLDQTGGAVSTGTDPLEIAGVGRGLAGSATKISSTVSGTSGVVLKVQSRPTTIHDLDIVAPASLSDGFGEALIAGSATIQNVDIQGQNLNGSDGVTLGGGSTFTNGSFYGIAGVEGQGSIDDAVTSGPPTGGATVSQVVINDASSGVFAFNSGTSLTIRRSLIVNPTNYGVLVNDSGIANVQNTVIRTNGTGIALNDQQFNNGQTGILTARNVTAVRSGATDTQPAVNAVVNAGMTSTAQIVMDDSIIDGYATAYARTGAVVGTANLAIRHSDLFYPGAFPAGSSSGTGSLTFAPNNIYADPQFAGATDFHLLPGSLAIDQADPASTITEDFDGAARPTDGDGEGTARNDMGAFEYQPPASPPPPATGSTNPPAAVPTVKKKCKKKKRAAATAKKCKKRKG